MVRYAFNDHGSGGALQLAVDEEFLFSTGLEMRIVQRLLTSPRAKPTLLFDQLQPHLGRVTALERMSGSPYLWSADTRGMMKLWDLRMGMCVQTILTINAHKCESEVGM